MNKNTKFKQPFEILTQKFLSKIIFKKCMCRSIARLDFILDSKSNCFYFLELNTHPGLTSISLAPEQAQYNGINYLSLIEKIISSSWLNENIIIIFYKITFFKINLWVISYNNISIFHLILT